MSKTFGETRAVEGVSLDIADGEFFALLGPSGCGKTTLLRLVAGFEMPDEGSVKLGDAVVGKPGWALPPEKRKIGMVFQSYALWPHMTVAENVAFALRVRRVAEAERVRIVERVRSSRSASRAWRSAARTSSPAASASASRWRAASPCGRASCCSTSRSPISTCICARRCSRSSRASTRRSARPSSTSPTTRPRRWRSPIASP